MTKVIKGGNVHVHPQIAQVLNTFAGAAPEQERDCEHCANNEEGYYTSPCASCPHGEWFKPYDGDPPPAPVTDPYIARLDAEIAESNRAMMKNEYVPSYALGMIHALKKAKQLYTQEADDEKGV